MSQPGFYFYTGDWVKDTRVLTPLMRGCWIDALCFLNENQGSVTWPISSFANFWGVTIDAAIEVLDAIAMAKVGNVSWQTDSKTIANLSNRRMLKEISKRAETKEKRTQAGKKGAAIRWQKCASSESSSSSLPSSKKKKEDKNKRAQAPLVLPDWVPQEAWVGYCEYRKQKKGWTQRAATLNLNKLEQLKNEGYDPEAVLNQTVSNGWSGLFPIRSQNERQSNEPRGFGSVREFLAKHNRK